MTLIAGALLPDGALLAADCRITWTASSGPIPTDYAQKLIKLNDSNILGYSGDVGMVNYLLPHIFEQIEKRRSDAVSLSRWLPRFLKATYRAMARQVPIGDVAFMIAGSVPGRETMLPGADVARLARMARALGIQDNLQFRARPSGRKSAVRILGSSQGLLYALRAPSFKREDCRPLSVVTIGSASPAVEQLKLYAPVMMTQTPDVAADFFLHALMAYFSGGDTTIGGMFLAARAHDGRVESLLVEELNTPDGVPIKLDLRPDGRIYLQRKGSDKQIQLLYPLEVARNAPRAPIRFDGLRDTAKAAREAYGRIGQTLTDRIVAGDQP